MKFLNIFRRGITSTSSPISLVDAAAEAQRAWVLLRPRVRLADGNFCLTMELTTPHAGEAAAQVRGRALAIQVLRTGSNINAADQNECYRRTVPLTEALDPDSLQIKITGDTLEIRAKVADDNQDAGSTGLHRSAWRQLANSVVVVREQQPTKTPSVRAYA